MIAFQCYNRKIYIYNEIYNLQNVLKKNKIKQFPRRGLCYNLVTRICSLTS